jgi:predicted Zn-dependent protease
MKFVVFLLVLPLWAQQNAGAYAAEKERALGQQYASDIRTRAKPLPDPLIQSYVKRIGGELVAELKRRGSAMSSR